MGIIAKMMIAETTTTMTTNMWQECGRGVSLVIDVAWRGGGGGGEEEDCTRSRRWWMRGGRRNNGGALNL